MIKVLTTIGLISVFTFVMILSNTGSMAAEVTLSEPSASDCMSAEGDVLIFHNIREQIVTIDTRDGSIVHLNYWYLLDGGYDSREMDLVVPQGEHIRSVFVLRGVAWEYQTSTCEFSDVIEEVALHQAHRNSLHVENEPLYSDWRSAGIFMEVDE